MLMLNVDKGSEVPAYRQIYEGIVRMVDGGTLSPGDRLPPTRVLARTVGVHRSTALRAYEELWALGYLESRQGSYSTVRQRMRAVTRTEPGRSLVDWDRATTPAATRARDDVARIARERVPPSPGTIDFVRLSADRRLTPSDDFRRCLKAALVEGGKELLDYGSAAGLPRLREVIARRLRTHGITVTADEIVVTNGAQQALDLVCRALTRPGDAIAVESPTYAMALPLFRLHGLDVRGVPMRDDGMDLDALERLLARRRPALVYTIPNFQNPTGITTGQEHRERLLALAEAHRLPILEDGFEEEMKYFGKAVLPVKSMDRGGVVVYAGTFSKVVFPGLRLGWLAAPRPLVERLVAIQRVSSLSGNGLAQAAAARFCEGGEYEAHLRRVHKVYRRRMLATLQALRDHMPPGVEWTEPVGGYTLWLRVKGRRLDEAALLERLTRERVRLSPGSLYFRQAPAEAHFRLSIACVDEADIVEGCRRIGRALAPAREA